jgi:hypothetical protein
LADAQASGACVRKDVGVQVPPRPPWVTDRTGHSWRQNWASEDHTARIWDYESCGPIGDVVQIARRRITRQLTVEERKTFLGGN